MCTVIENKTDSITNIISYAESLNNKIKGVLVTIESERQRIKKEKHLHKAYNEANRQIESYLNSSAAILLVLSDFLFEITTCEEISELEFLLNYSKENCEIGI